MRTFLLALLSVSLLSAQIPENLIVEGVPSLPAELIERLQPYYETRSAVFNDWHPSRREMLITTRFGDTTQLHQVRMPGGDRKQLTFFVDRVSGGKFRPENGDAILLSKDVGGGEFFQFYLHDLATGTNRMVTDGKSRNTGAVWSNSGKQLAFSSTKRNGKDTDIYVMTPEDPSSARLLLQVDGGGWNVTDWSEEDAKVIVQNYLSANESELYLVDVKTGQKRLLTPATGQKVSYSGAEFSPDGKAIYFTHDQDSEFKRLVRMELAGGRKTTLTPSLNWNVESFDLSPDGKWLAFVSNEDSIGVLHLIDVASAREKQPPQLPPGIVSNIEWHPNSRDLALNIASHRSPADVYSIDVAKGTLDRWTESETGGLNTAQNVAPEFVRIKSFDGLPVSGILYRPDPAKHPGKRPIAISIHGGPEGQARPGFQGNANFLINELGIALFYPNVRGSTGYGKTFLTLDNGMKREDSVRDIGAFIDVLKRDPRLEGDRILVQGGSYGGYMTLAAMTHYSDRVRAAVSVVGISNFISFLQNTQDYRRDLRRAEYGDERDPAMREYFEKIAPLHNAAKISRPMLIVQGYNDPRVPRSESEQIHRSLKERGIPVWFLMARDEGHGFAKKKNQMFQAAATILFLQQYLLN